MLHSSFSVIISAIIKFLTREKFVVIYAGKEMIWKFSLNTVLRYKSKVFNSSEEVYDVLQAKLAQSSSREFVVKAFRRTLKWK